MADNMSGIQTATVEPEEGKPPVAILAVVGVVLLGGLGWYLMGSGADEGPWASTAPVPEESTCKIDKGMGAVPDVDAVDCHPSEMAKNQLLPPEAMMLPAASVSMYRSSTDGEWLVVRYRGLDADDAAVGGLLASIAPQGPVAKGNAETLALPAGWPTGDAWRPSWPLPEGEGALSWVQLPEGDHSCTDEQIRGAFVFRQGDELIATKWSGKAACPLWKQIQRGRKPWQRGFGGSFGGGMPKFGGGL